MMIFLVAKRGINSLSGKADKGIIQMLQITVFPGSSTYLVVTKVVSLLLAKDGSLTFCLIIYNRELEKKTSLRGESQHTLFAGGFRAK